MTANQEVFQTWERAVVGTNGETLQLVLLQHVILLYKLSPSCFDDIDVALTGPNEIGHLQSESVECSAS